MASLKSRLHEGLQAGLLSQLLRHVGSCRLCFTVLPLMGVVGDNRDIPCVLTHSLKPE